MIYLNNLDLLFHAYKSNKNPGKAGEENTKINTYQIEDITFLFALTHIKKNTNLKFASGSRKY